jgi:3-isopropylmalate/(R)-2-methylmalate dehydratase large subunit
METLANKCAETGVTLFGIDSEYQGVVHVMGPDRPDPAGNSIVCGEATPPPWRFWCPGFGHGTAKSNTSWPPVPATEKVQDDEHQGQRGPGTGVNAKDIIIGVISQMEPILAPLCP